MTVFTQRIDGSSAVIEHTGLLKEDEVRKAAAFSVTFIRDGGRYLIVDMREAMFPLEIAQYVSTFWIGVRNGLGSDGARLLALAYVVPWDHPMRSLLESQALRSGLVGSVLFADTREETARFQRCVGGQM